jgi:hypothetical protein
LRRYRWYWAESRAKSGGSAAASNAAAELVWYASGNCCNLDRNCRSKLCKVCGAIMLDFRAWCSEAYMRVTCMIAREPVNGAVFGGVRKKP